MATFQHLKDKKRALLEVPDSDKRRIEILEASNRYKRVDGRGRATKEVVETSDGIGNGKNPATPNTAPPPKRREFKNPKTPRVTITPGAAGSTDRNAPPSAPRKKQEAKPKGESTAPPKVNQEEESPERAARRAALPTSMKDLVELAKTHKIDVPAVGASKKAVADLILNAEFPA